MDVKLLSGSLDDTMRLVKPSDGRDKGSFNGAWIRRDKKKYKLRY